jgi:hypothetical protein
VKRTPFLMTMIGGVSLAILGGITLAARITGSADRGWQVVATSQNDKLVAVILANPLMIEARSAPSVSALYAQTEHAAMQRVGEARAEEQDGKAAAIGVLQAGGASSPIRPKGA